MARILALGVLSLALTSGLVRWAQQPVPWHDPSPHKVQFVQVEEGTQLEVLDWGGRGRNVLLLAGSGNTAHVFDDFAKKLSAFCHAYGVTRRGFGASSHSESGYTDQRLADDVLHVLNSLKIEAPVLVGHSMAGSELTTLGNQQSDRVAGLVYLDAADDPMDFPASSPAYMSLYQKLPEPMRGHPGPGPADLRSFQAYREWQMRSGGVAFPEAELRNTHDANADGSVGKPNAYPGVHDAIDKGSIKRDYSKIRVPILAFFPSVGGTSKYQPKDEQERAAIAAFDAATAAYINRYRKNIQSAPTTVRIVDVPGANHYVFLSNEGDVLRELRNFLTAVH